MNKENTEVLFDTFPYLYSGRFKPITENLMSYGFECDDGWFSLIFELSAKLSKIDPTCIAVQVKEKFGGLRFYTDGASEKAHNLIGKYENLSYDRCELCGSIENVKLRGTNWIKSLCDNCNKDKLEK